MGGAVARTRTGEGSAGGEAAFWRKRLNGKDPCSRTGPGEREGNFGTRAARKIEQRSQKKERKGEECSEEFSEKEWASGERRKQKNQGALNHDTWGISSLRVSDQAGRPTTRK